MKVNGTQITCCGVTASGGSFTFGTTGGNGSTGALYIFNSTAADGSSGTEPVVGITPGINQTGTAGYVALLVNPTETTIGSGSNYLAEFEKGGAVKVVITSAGLVGIGTATPANALDVNGSLAVGSYAGTATGASNELVVSGDVGIGTTSPNGLLDVYGGHLLASRGGTAPSISSCGTGASVSGTDNSFLLTMGSGALTSCAVTFGAAWTTAPNSCVLFPANATAAATGTTGAYVSAISTTTLTVTGLNLTGAAYYGQCY